jgi:signal transduction histidine kinase
MADHNRHDEARIVRSNGEIVWVQVSRSEIRSERGQVLGAVYVYTDISKRKEAEQHALELGIEKERVHLLSQFVEDASHEFYTPLSVMKTQLYLLEKYLPEDNRAKEKLFSLNQQSNVIQDLVQALVLMSKLDSTRGLSMRPYKLNALIEQVTDELRPIIENKQQHLYLEMSREDLIVDCDAEKLRLAIKEILDNAHRYTATGGNIILRLFRRDEQAIMEIRDTGLGMNEEIQSHIFERFYRADKARSTRGFGLGLSIAKRIIDLHEGEISVQSQPQLGSTFRIILAAGEEA